MDVLLIICDAKNHQIILGQKEKSPQLRGLQNILAKSYRASRTQIYSHSIMSNHKITNKINKLKIALLAVPWKIPH